ncbi:(d)CMP kinase [Pedomonas mirosovicensis]|uniref:(d)CMP kinase n=1 Tax=Pedomonas mirosovicensis TaxID=2908641 RepID=UPI0021680DBE|nr:(d)CMP kinase [Pedomonas mirosovicensis]MCH8684183.1 (d)CMP kinase [Pedomonas mirosovicensis]
MIIAVDGPSASGKGTLARRLAQHYGLRHLDTGALYRMVGLAVLLSGGDPADEAAALAAARTIDLSLLEHPELRSEVTGGAASKVAAQPAVRAALLQFQRDFANENGGAVLDGRDIGTVVCPEASVKLFVIARADVRARRRHAELTRYGVEVSYETVLADIEARDARDMNRAVAPLKPAPDALLLDTSDLDIDAAVQQALSLVDSRLAELKLGSRAVRNRP